ncbi:Sterol 3-beta-glucosyltransferase [Symbiodinium microadriaticum]|uniref:Sterol 3-beta-glucosyltransferase n=1 Tax=Symbiodinium microadriaticum TaxID=2951 RepID=A0A1Q9DJD9_SYMMI|nr:Sterol 3-beta-glucosyltransferase [Symbiodinium microadriaticum]
MKCAVCNVGTRGDLQPLIALGLGLQKKGWDVVVISEERIRPLVEEFALEFRSIAGDSTGIIFEQEYAEMLAKGKLMAMMQETQKRKATWYEQFLTDLVDKTKDIQMIISGPLVYSETYCVAEKLGVPWIPVLYGPLYPTAEFPNSFVMESNWFGWLNLFTYNFLFWALWMQEGGQINSFREKLGLSPLQVRRGMMTLIEEKQLLVIGGFHEVIIPQPKAPADWPESFFFPNFFFVPDTPADAVPSSLKSFLAQAGSRPVVYLGLGSMPAPRPQELVSLAEAIVEKLEVSAVLCAGWSDISFKSQDTEQRILVTKSAPHDFLLPRCRVLLHHAGAGTCAAALRAGVPSVCLPVMLDQPNNAKNLTRLGVATPPILFQDVAAGVDRVVESVKTALESSEMRAKAEAIAGRIRESDGVSRAIERPIPFDFLVEGEFLRSSISSYLEAHKLSSEKVLKLEFVLALREPEQSTVDETPDWIASVVPLQGYPSSWFAAVSYDGTLRVYENSEARVTSRLSDAGLAAVAALPVDNGRGSHLVAAGLDGSLRCCSLRHDGASSAAAGKVAERRGATVPQALQAAAISEDGTMLAGAGWSSQVYVWNADDELFAPPSKEGPKRKATAQPEAPPKFCLGGHSQVVTALSFGAKEKFPFTLLSASWDCSLRVWDIAAASCVCNWPTARAVTSFSSNPAMPPQMATSHEDGHVSLWDVRAPPHAGAVHGTQLIPGWELGYAVLETRMAFSRWEGVFEGCKSNLAVAAKLMPKGQEISFSTILEIELRLRKGWLQNRSLDVSLPRLPVPALPCSCLRLSRRIVAWHHRLPGVDRESASLASDGDPNL